MMRSVVAAAMWCTRTWNIVRGEREISTCLLESSLAAIAGSVDVRDMDAEDIALLVYNASPSARTDVTALVLDTPASWGNQDDFDILDELGRPVVYQRIGLPRLNQTGVHNPHDVQLFFQGKRQVTRLAVEELPVCGYRVYRVMRRARRKVRQPTSLCTEPQTMSNEYLTVTINPNGTLDVLCHATRQPYRGLGYFRDSGATGTAWEHQSPARDRVFTTLNERANHS